MNYNLPGKTWPVAHTRITFACPQTTLFTSQEITYLQGITNVPYMVG